MPWGSYVSLVVISLRREGEGEPHQCYPRVYRLVGQEPVHERPLGRHHVRVLPRLLRLDFPLRQCWARVRFGLGAQSSRVRGGSEFIWLFEHACFLRRAGRCMAELEEVLSESWIAKVCLPSR